MKHLFLVANTSIDRIERAIEKTGKKNPLSSILLFGRYKNPSLLAGIDIYLMLGTESFRANQDVLNPDGTGFLFADPMNLSCIENHENISILDFRKKENGFGFYVDRVSSSDIAKEILKVRKKQPSIIEMKMTDPVPKILDSATSSTSFLSDFLGCNYSIKDNLVREKWKILFVTWILSDKSVKKLKKSFIKLTGKTKSRRIVTLCNLFDSDEGKKARAAIRIIADAVAKNKSVNTAKIASGFSVSLFDIRYMHNFLKTSSIPENI